MINTIGRGQAWRFCVLWILLITLAGTSCSRYTNAERFVQAIGAPNLISFARSLEGSEFRKTRDGHFPKETWPESFAKLGVVEVNPYFGGLQIVLEKRGRSERGVYIPTKRMDPPEDGSGIHFKKLATGIYWFEQKDRAEYIPLEQRNPAS